MHPRKITEPDIHFLNAAIGWLELGDYAEANSELERISFLTRFHPDVLLVRWKVFARMKDWNRSLDVGRALVKIAPNRPTGWICLAYSLYNTGCQQEAWSQLKQAATKFPQISAIPYFLACLACQMGNTSEATHWLTRWNSMVRDESLKETARKDPRLQSAWEDFDDEFFDKVYQESTRIQSAQKKED